MKRITVFLILVGFPFIILHAQKKWTLKECITYATEKNMDIKSSGIAINSSQILVEKSKLNFVPNLNIYTDYQFNISRSLDPATYSFIENMRVNTVNSGMYLETTLFDGFKRYNNYRKNLSDLDVSKADYEALKNDVSLAVTVGYMNVLLNKEVISSIKQQIDISNNNIEKASRLLEEGVITDENLQNILIQKDNETYSLADAEGNYQNALISLCSLLNLKDYDSFEVEDSLFFDTDESVPLADIISSALFLPQIEAMKSRLRSAEYSLKIANSDLYPTLSFGASFTGSFSDARKKIWLDYPFFDQLSNHRNGYVSLSFNYPITNFFQTKKNISLAKNAIIQSQYDIQIAEKNMIERIYQIYTEVETAKKKQEASLSSAKHSKAVLVYADNKLANGTLTANDYIITKNNLLISEAQASKAKYEYLFKFKLLMFYYSHKII